MYLFSSLTGDVLHPLFENTASLFILSPLFLICFAGQIKSLRYFFASFRQTSDDNNTSAPGMYALPAA